MLARVNLDKKSPLDFFPDTKWIQTPSIGFFFNAQSMLYTAHSKPSNHTKRGQSN